MKIFILNIDSRFRPDKQLFHYPVHNKDYGVEQDFYNFLLTHKEFVTDNESKADFLYIPIYWTRYFLNNDYGKKGVTELQRELNLKLKRNKKHFTICQYDDGPMVKMKNTLVFLSSRKKDDGIDIPLLSSDHKTPFFRPKKKYLMSFIGRLDTHIIRKEMSDAITSYDDVLIQDKNQKEKPFVNNILSSYVSLCPRGYGGSSFRFYESMQLGTVPFMVSDIDTRPFKKFIDWEKISLFTNNPRNIISVINKYTKNELLIMGRNAQREYYEKIRFTNWCKLVLKELESHEK